MQNLFYGSIALFALALNLSSTNAAAMSSSLEVALPEVGQGADVHSLSSTYCRALWSQLKKPDILGYDTTASSTFRDKFVSAVAELDIVLKRISRNEPVMVGHELILCSDFIVEEELSALAEYFDAAAYGNLAIALNSMKELGKHKGGSDLDSETMAHVNEIFVYAWGKVKEDPDLRLAAFLIGLTDAAPTCIQGYSVRMLCAVHPPKQKK